MSEMNLQAYTTRVQSGEHLLFDEMVTAAQLVFNDHTPKEDIAAFLLALSAKG